MRGTGAGCPKGALPVGVVADGMGNLFGVKQQGGRKNSGVISKFKP
jgi:hypothetical protein